MIIGSLASLAVNRQDIGGVTSPVSDGRTAPAAAARSTGAAGTEAAGSSGVVYVSPFARYDYTSRLEILQFRNPDTGKVTLQIPPEKVVDAYRRVAAYGGKAPTPQSVDAVLLGRTVPAAASQDNRDTTATAVGAAGTAAATGGRTAAGDSGGGRPVTSPAPTPSPAPEAPPAPPPVVAAASAAAPVRPTAATGSAAAA
ncbi:MAG: hypothetical protein WCO00_17205 [Rhodospirillaceae bacterium]